jgi:hypothetical protein
MMEYKFKRGYSADEQRILEVLKSCFPVEPEKVEKGYVISFGALKSMHVWIENKKLHVITESNRDANEEEILQTNKMFRDFLTKATGYTTKERIKMAQKEAVND